MTPLKLLILLLAAMPILAIEYVVISDATATAHAITIQQPASGGRRVRGIVAHAQCDAVGDVVIERNGTAAANTEVAPATMEPGAPAAKFKAFTGSDVGSGVVLRKLKLQAGVESTLDLRSHSLFGDGTDRNFTVRATPTGSTRCILVVKVEE